MTRNIGRDTGYEVQLQHPTPRFTWHVYSSHYFWMRLDLIFQKVFKKNYPLHCQRAKTPMTHQKSRIDTWHTRRHVMTCLQTQHNLFFFFYMGPSTTIVFYGTESITSKSMLHASTNPISVTHVSLWKIQATGPSKDFKAHLFQIQQGCENSTA